MLIIEDLMRKISITTVIIVLISYQSFYSQSVSVGFKADPYVLITERFNEIKSFPYVTSFYVLGGIKASSILHFDIEYGLQASEDYGFNGFEVSLIGKYLLRENKEYILIGYTHHKNGGGNSSGHRTVDKYLSLASLGVGTYISNTFFVQVVYQFPLGDNVYAKFRTWDFIKGIYNEEPLRVIGLVKFGFGVSFDL